MFRCETKLKGTVAWDGILLIQAHLAWQLWIWKFFCVGRLITELRWKLRHLAYSASTLNDTKRTCRVRSILFHVLTKYAQFHRAYLAMIFTCINNCKLCVLGEYAQFHCAYLPSMSNVIPHTRWVHQTAIKLQKMLTTLKGHWLKIYMLGIKCTLSKLKNRWNILSIFKMYVIKRTQREC